MTKHLRNLGCLLLLSLSFSLVASGQTDAGSIVGTVTDNSGAVLANESVTITNTGNNAKVVVKTDSSGHYSATPLKIGTYTVSVEAQGFKSVTRNGIVLNVQDRLRVDFTLQVGSVSEQMIVTSSAPLLQSESSALGDVIESKQIADLPLNGRDYTQLAALTTGVVKVTESGNGLTGGAQSAANGNAGGSFSVNGTRGMLNNFLLDGIDNNSNDNGGNVLKTNVDAIAEFKVQTSNYSAEFGRSGGAVINATIKSGTNRFHGNVFEFLRNSALDAKDYFESPGDKKAPFRQNQFGFTFGGPAIHDKLFFFTDYQGTRVGSSTIDQSKVPTLAEREGDFSAFLPDTTIYDPQTTTVVGGVVTRTPFPGNIIPANRFDTIAHNLLELYPLPNVTDPNTASNFVRVDPGTLRIDQGDARVVEQAEQGVVVDAEIADHAALVERGPRIALVVVGQAEGVQQLVIGAVEKHLVALVDDDEGDRTYDGAGGVGADAGHADRIGARDEAARDLRTEGAFERRLEMFGLDQAHFDVGRRIAGDDAQMQIGNAAGVFVEDARHGRGAVERAGGNHAHGDRMIETADTLGSLPDQEFGAEGKREKTARQFRRREAGVLRRRAGKGAGRRRLAAGRGERRGRHNGQQQNRAAKTIHLTVSRCRGAGAPGLPAPPRRPACRRA